ncbi:MAG: hypothetical protein ACFFD4_18990 [Candidatus Odinarchaeota archaeon]
MARKTHESRGVKGLIGLLLPGEAETVLETLANRNQELADLVSGTILNLIKKINREEVAAGALAAFQAITVDELYDKLSTEMRDTYDYPGEVMGELINRILEPQVVRMVRCLWQGLDMVADEIVTGLLESLHGYDQEISSEMDEMLDGRLSEIAHLSVFKPWNDYRGEEGREKVETFVKEKLTGWKWMLEEE